MIFKSLDTSASEEEETIIRSTVSSDVTLFIQTWVTYFLNKLLTQPDFRYSLFPWNKIIKLSFTVGSNYKCYSAITGDRLDGLISLQKNKDLHIAYIATAPWNYYTIGKMRRIGSGLVYFTIKNSEYIGNGGEFFLNAVPDAEKFYESIGMIHTGIVMQGMKEYFMDKVQSRYMVQCFEKYVVEE